MRQLDPEVQTKVKKVFIKAQKVKEYYRIASFCNAEKLHFCQVYNSRFSLNINNYNIHCFFGIKWNESFLTSIERNDNMPKVFLSPSTQEWNQYATDGNEELYMNLLADRIEPYLRCRFQCRKL